VIGAQVEQGEGLSGVTVVVKPVERSLLSQVISGPVWVVDPDTGKVLDSNTKAQAMFGASHKRGYAFHQYLSPLTYDAPQDAMEAICDNTVDHREDAALCSKMLNKALLQPAIEATLHLKPDPEIPDDTGKQIMVDMSAAGLAGDDPSYLPLGVEAGLVVDGTGMLLFGIDKEGKLGSCNMVAADLMGGQEGVVEDMLGWEFAEFVIPEDLPRMRGAVKRAIQGETVELDRISLLSVDSLTEVFSTCTVHPKYDTSGAITGCICEAFDITDRQFQADIADHIEEKPDLVQKELFCVDLNGDIAAASTFTTDIMGESIIGTKLVAHVVPGEGADNLESALRLQEHCQVDIQFVPAALSQSGSLSASAQMAPLSPMTVEVMPRFDQNGKLCGMVVARDGEPPVCCMDEDGVIIMCNQAAATLLGFEDRGELIGLTMMSLIQDSKNNNGAALNVLMEALNTGATGECTCDLTDKTGTPMKVKLEASKQKSAAEKGDNVVMVTLQVIDLNQLAYRDLFTRRDGKVAPAKRRQRLKKAEEITGGDLNEGDQGSKHVFHKFKVDDYRLQRVGSRHEGDLCKFTFRSMTAGHGDNRNIDEITFEDFRQWLLRVPPGDRPAGLKNVNPWKTASIRTTFDQINRDGGKTITYEEWQSWWDSWNKREEKKNVIENMLQLHMARSGVGSSASGPIRPSSRSSMAVRVKR